MPARCNVCQEEFEDGDIDVLLDHLRVMHPEQYGDGPLRWPDGQLVVMKDNITTEDFEDEEA